MQPKFYRFFSIFLKKQLRHYLGRRDNFYNSSSCPETGQQSYKAIIAILDPYFIFCSIKTKKCSKKSLLEYILPCFDTFFVFCLSFQKFRLQQIFKSFCKIDYSLVCRLSKLVRNKRENEYIPTIFPA